jgi:peptidoglycan/LPS O-acetylase OafA/YrhL
LVRFWLPGRLRLKNGFYIVWALLVFFLSDKTLTRLCLALIALSPLFRYLAFHSGWPAEHVCTFTLTRLDGLAAGCLLAFIPFRLRDSVAMLILGGVGLPCAMHFQWKSFVGSFALLFFSGVILMAHRGGIVPTWTPLRYIGKISYGLYLLHIPVFDTIREFAHPQGMLQSMAVFVFDIGGTIVAASLSWYLLERPILGWKRFFESECETPSTVRTISHPLRA